jgi:streptogramin lyase/mono/diheme cytochrome c family protein
MTPLKIAAFMLALLPWAGTASSQSAVALSGHVRAAAEGAMEGVLVSAHRDGSNITVTVVSDNKGEYAFPATRLTPGHYTVAIRAVGYDLSGPDAAGVSAEAPATLDLTLRKTTDLAAQLTNAEWMESLPGQPEQKQFLQNCASCHSLHQPLYSKHTVDEFVTVQERMAHYSAASSLLIPQVLLADRVANQGEFALEKRHDAIRKQAEYLAGVTMNAADTWNFPLKTFHRPTGRATHEVITEYDLPEPTRMPHDVIVTPDGTVWYDSFAEQVLGRLDPKTGKTTEYTVPTLKPDSPKGSLALRADSDGNLWLGMAFQAGVARFDPKTETFRVFPVPPERNKDFVQTTEVEPTHANVDGKVWIEDSGTYSIYRLDIATGKYEVFQPFPIPSPNIYDISSDAENNLYFTVFGRGDIGRVDAKTGAVTTWPTPTPNSAPRRGALDGNGKLWFGEFRADRFGMFDTNTHTFREWTPPTPWYFPYDVVADRNGDVWGGSMQADRVDRLDPRSGTFTEYLLPRHTNMRRSFVDDRTTPVSFWVGSNHGASIVRLEPGD